jgi:ABC-type molybdate transport system substrate-binding protein
MMKGLGMKKKYLIIALVAALGLSGCARSVSNLVEIPETVAITSSGAQSIKVTRFPSSKTLTVFAAASLTDVFKDIGKEFDYFFTEKLR